jgi:hypothetical protein
MTIRQTLVNSIRITLWAALELATTIPAFSAPRLATEMFYGLREDSCDNGCGG